MNELKPLDINTLQKVQVRDRDTQDWQEARLIYVIDSPEFTNGLYVAQLGDKFDMTEIFRFNHCRPYKEPVTFTGGKVVGREWDLEELEEVIENIVVKKLKEVLVGDK